jgi:hypothetical protein
VRDQRLNLLLAQEGITHRHSTLLSH